MNTATIGTAATVSNGNFATTNSNCNNTASGSENRKPATAHQLVRENVQFLIDYDDEISISCRSI